MTGKLPTPVKFVVPYVQFTFLVRTYPLGARPEERAVVKAAEKLEDCPDSNSQMFQFHIPAGLHFTAKTPLSPSTIPAALLSLLDRGAHSPRAYCSLQLHFEGILPKEMSHFHTISQRTNHNSPESSYQGVRFRPPPRLENFSFVGSARFPAFALSHVPVSACGQYTPGTNL